MTFPEELGLFAIKVSIIVLLLCIAKPTLFNKEDKVWKPDKATCIYVLEYGNPYQAHYYASGDTVYLISKY